MGTLKKGRVFLDGDEGEWRLELSGQICLYYGVMNRAKESELPLFHRAGNIYYYEELNGHSVARLGIEAAC